MASKRASRANRGARTRGLVIYLAPVFDVELMRGAGGHGENEKRENLLGGSCWPSCDGSPGPRRGDRRWSFGEVWLCPAMGHCIVRGVVCLWNDGIFVGGVRDAV